MVDSHNNHALVIGASGLIGWSVVNQLLLQYPSPGSFSKVTALMNRPLKVEHSFWPEEAEGRPAFNLVSGVNLLCSGDELEGVLKEKVEGVERISHVFYFAFKEDPDAEKEVSVNVGMMRRVVKAVRILSTSFQFFVYPGGTRGYGIYLPGGMFSAPLTESMADTLPADYAKTVSYPHYRALLSKESAGEKWSWCELCPDVIVGFTPNGSGYSLAGHWAVYLFAWKLVHGEGAEIPYPGTVKGYEALYTETSATTLARVAVHASLHSESFREKIFNVADSATPGSMRERWPQITSWFGLKGIAPPETATSDDPKPSDFIKENEGRLRDSDVKGVDIWNAGQLDSVGNWLTFDRYLSLEKLRRAGFKEERKPKEGWWETFGMFRKAGMIR